ncbi:hypothetical protein L0152_10675 [bacterium]|nr:hypothetical protein [bacterium]
MNEELSRVPNYKTMIDATINWERLIQYPTFREGFVLSIEVTYKRGFVFECQKFLAKEINEPYSWKEPWINEEKKAGLQQYLYIGKNSMPVGKEIVFFIDPACCDNFPTASLSCAFKLIPINLLNEMATTCTKYYSSQVIPANKSMQRTLTACSLCSPAGSRR